MRTHYGPAVTDKERTMISRRMLMGATLASGVATVPFAAASAAASIGDPIDLRPFERWIVETFAPAVKVGPGAGDYARKIGEGVDLYGVADMAGILYTLNRLTVGEEERRQWNAAFAQFQRAGDGLLVERVRSHDPLHNTAYALASMELLDLKPPAPVRLPSEANPAAFLETIDWHADVYMGSHRGAGAGSIHYLLHGPDPQWFARYFAKCDSLFDPRFGMMGRNKPVGGDTDAIGGTFHYGFLYEMFHRTMPFAEARIDSILGLRRPDGYWHPQNRLWMTLDALYLLTRTLRYTTHRFDEVRGVVAETMRTLARDVYSPEGRVRSFSGALPTHSVMAAISIAAEAQRFLGGEAVVTERPLRLVLDRRPFI